MMTRVRNRDGRRGFTLIELLLVVVIIGILAAIVVPKLVGRTEDAQKSAVQDQLAHFRSALSMYEIDNGRYPEKLEDLVVNPNAELKRWKKLMDEVPKDPWGHDYKYQCPGTKNADGYDLFSFGKDGTEGSEDDIWK